MRISIIGPGIMPIPPTGWGAVESLIWDYYQELTKIGHEVQIVNTSNPQEIVNQVNSFSPDFVHLQYDNLYGVLPYISCPNKAITSHYGYLEQQNLYGGYWNIFNAFVNGNFKIFGLSQGILEMYRKAGVPEDRLYLTPNGARSDLFEFTKESKFPDRSIFLAKITDRKKQYLYQNLDFIDFAGNIDDFRFNTSRSNFLGEWTKEFLYKNLTNYANLVLLSDGEAHPLVCCEALVCGLGLVVSEFAAANLDTSLPFIDVVPTDRLNDLEYISQIIRKNQSVSSSIREEIREYGLNIFDWTKIVKSYSELVQDICK